MGFCLHKIPMSFKDRVGNGNLPGSDGKEDRAAVREAEPCRSTVSVSRVGWLSGTRMERYNWTVKLALLDLDTMRPKSLHCNVYT